ncbi:hypothetical protein GC093_15680 [Paenibacillus sp. LMG 31456]|uniref:Uncharacterized protein n=1 Tax=Paenibacillus foliorum TaxID=2654974 RepID=A0A972GUD1_9BACL|nr:hypothetical protein [Paenibacillus foliorum]
MLISNTEQGVSSDEGGSSLFADLQIGQQVFNSANSLDFGGCVDFLEERMIVCISRAAYTLGSRHTQQY